MTKKQTNPLRVAYFGTPRFSTFVLDALYEAGYTPTLVVTTPDRPAGRGLQLTESPVKKWALEKEIAVTQPETLRKESPELSILKNSEWDLFVVAGYGKILPTEIINLPKYGALNVHPSLLPRFRGSSPIETQILQDEKTIGVSILLMDEEMDHGPIVAQKSITPETWPMQITALENMLWQAGGSLLVESIPPFIDGSLVPTPQDHTKATLTKKMEKEDGLINLSDDGYTNYLKFCAYGEWPGTFFFVEKGGKKIRVKIKDAAFDGQIFLPTIVVPEGKNEQPYSTLLASLQP